MKHLLPFQPPIVLASGLVCLIAIVLFTAQPADAQDVDREDSQPTSTIANQWLRHVFNVQNPEETSVVYVGDFDRAQVWLNGQRLKTKVVQAAAFDVRPLLRRGPNCLAIAIAEHDSNSQSETLPITLKLGNRKPGQLRFRITTTQPPVGWQKTDFNDRDWKQQPKPLFKTDLSTSKRMPVVSKPKGQRRAGGQFRFLDGDHIVLLGGTFFERAQQFGHLESALLRSPARGLTFRNLGWSADTVWAESRGIFDAPAKGYARMIEHLRSEEPDVVILHYGQNEAMQPGSGVDNFVDQLKTLVSDIRTTGAEVVLSTPHPFVKSPKPLPDASLWNPELKGYAEAVERVAGESDCFCANLFADFESRMIEAAVDNGYWKPGLTAETHPELSTGFFQSLTDNGMHWNDRGYECVADVFANALFGSRHPPMIDPEMSSELREIVIRKNELYFHRWRPQNITYLFGFRKHEQGNNAAEIAAFDPLVAELEKRIHDLVKAGMPTPLKADK